jgi:hypothetical protein
MKSHFEVQSHMTNQHWCEIKSSKQAGILCRDAVFAHWLLARHPGECDVANIVRKICHVDSRIELDADTIAAERWHALEETYRQDIGMMAEQRG